MIGPVLASTEVDDSNEVDELELVGPVQVDRIDFRD